MSGDFRVILDDKVMRRYLEGLDERGVTKILRAGIRKGAPLLRAAIKATAPVKQRASGGAHGFYGVQRRGVIIQKDYGTPGGLKRSVKVARIRSNPAIGVVVGPMGKLAFMRWWVTQGTKPHLIRARPGQFLALGLGRVVHHPGARANPFVARGASAFGPAMDAAEAFIIKEATGE